MSSFILVACGPMLADKLGVPGARPRLEPDSRAVSSGVSVFLLPEPETGCQPPGPAERKLLGKSLAQTVSSELFLYGEKCPFIQGSVHQSHSLSLQHSASDGKKLHAGAQQTQKSKLAANGYPVNNNLASIMRGRAEYTH